MPHAVEMEGVSCRLGRVQALAELSLAVEEGTVLGVVGPNGAGKTTLIDVVCGLLRPDAGRVRVLGATLGRDTAAIRRRIGLVPQETALYAEATGWQNLRLAADLYGVPDARARIREVLDLVGLTARAGDRVGALSGGMQRRLAIARALLHEPALLVLDEPTLGVDLEARHQVWRHVRGLRAQGRTVLLTTNYLDEAEALCDRVALLRAGRLVAEDTPLGLVARAGRCLEIECSDESADRIGRAVAGLHEVLRVETTGTGLTVYVDHGRPAEAVAGHAMAAAPVTGLRVRSPDLAEIFRVLTGEGERP